MLFLSASPAQGDLQPRDPAWDHVQVMSHLRWVMEGVKRDGKTVWWSLIIQSHKNLHISHSDEINQKDIPHVSFRTSILSVTDDCHVMSEHKVWFI